MYSCVSCGCCGSWHASCALANNRVLIHGGYNGNVALNDAFIFDLGQPLVFPDICSIFVLDPLCFLLDDAHYDTL